jgi:ABC-type multidrug transport system fused ATPase/permease subunit
MVLQFSQPFIIGMLIDGLTGTSKIELNQGLALACALGLVSFSSSCCIAAAMFNSRQLGLQVRTAMMMAVFEKSLRLTNAARMKSSVGNVTNLMAIDAEKLLLAVQFLNFLWHGPCAFFLSLVALYFEVGPSAIAGFALLAMLIPLQKTLSKSIGSSRRQISKASDRRVQRMSEILQGIRCLKLLSWEFNMVKKVQEDREEELKHIWTYLKFNGFLREIMFMAGPLTAVVIFTVINYNSFSPFVM